MDVRVVSSLGNAGMATVDVQEHIQRWELTQLYIHPMTNSNVVDNQ